MSAKKPRPFETLYFGDLRYTNPRLAVTRGFPKAEVGSIEGASKAVARGYVRKVQCIDRIENPGAVLWTVKAGRKVPGVNIIPVEVYRGDPDAKPARRTER